MRKDEQTELDAAVKAGRLTKADEQRILKDVDKRIDALVNGTLRERFRDHREFRGGFDRQPPPSSLPAA
jgi:urease accessory protein UreF